jgi:uncharacterized protein
MSRDSGKGLSGRESGNDKMGSGGRQNMSRKTTVDQRKLGEIIRRIVKVAAPEKIILFGSAARGEMGPNSDVDLLVIKRGRFHRGRLTEKIYMNLFGVGQAVDVIVVTSADVKRYGDCFALVIYPALREGKVVYAA